MCESNSPGFKLLLTSYMKTWVSYLTFLNLTLHMYKICTIIYTSNLLWRSTVSVRNTFTTTGTRKYSLYIYFPPVSGFCCFDLAVALLYFRGLTERTQVHDSHAVFTTPEERQSRVPGTRSGCQNIYYTNHDLQPINLLVLFSLVESFHWCLSAATKDYPSL